MSKTHKVRIESNGRCDAEGDTRVFIDDQDVTNSVTDVTWTIGLDRVSRAIVTFSRAELTVDYMATHEVPVQVLKRDENVTVVPGAYFEALVADPDEPNERVREAARRLPNVVRREEA